jgi:hypothetical protein
VSSLFSAPQKETDILFKTYQGWQNMPAMLNIFELANL